MKRLKRELKRCWPSLVGAGLIVPGYWLVGDGHRVGWILMAASNVFMIVVAVMTRQWGLFVAVLPMGTAIRNFLLT